MFACLKAQKIAEVPKIPVFPVMSSGGPTASNICRPKWLLVSTHILNRLPFTMTSTKDQLETLFPFGVFLASHDLLLCPKRSCRETMPDSKWDLGDQSYSVVQLNYSGVCPNYWHGFQSFRNCYSHRQNASQNIDIKVINSGTKNWYGGFVLILNTKSTNTNFVYRIFPLNRLTEICIP